MSVNETGGLSRVVKAVDKPMSHGERLNAIELLVAKDMRRDGGRRRRVAKGKMGRVMRSGY